MRNDLTTQRPIYPLSCYGPGRDAPRQLIEGPVEISPEELRVRYYAQRLAGNEAGAVSILRYSCTTQLMVHKATRGKCLEREDVTTSAVHSERHRGCHSLC